ncbi:hypothetical protein [Herbaspirillum sp. B65]|jgi:hypothetical protein|nr:hypothetical protein [Herbaspirillum sp. B65]
MKAFLLIVTPWAGDTIRIHTIADSTAGAIEQHILDFWPYKKIEARPA